MAGHHGGRIPERPQGSDHGALLRHQSAQQHIEDQGGDTEEQHRHHPRLHLEPRQLVFQITHRGVVAHAGGQGHTVGIQAVGEQRERVGHGLRGVERISVGAPPMMRVNRLFFIRVARTEPVLFARRI